MTAWRRLLGVSVFSIVAFLVIPAGIALGANASSASTGASAALRPSPGPTGAHANPASASVLHALAERHVPMRDVFLPNYDARSTSAGGIVHPGYTAPPAPMGLGYFGVQSVGGKDVGSISYTRSIEGSATLRHVDPFYLASSSPDIFTMQLNTVLTHVTVFGNHSGVYWIQNVPIYTASTQTLGIEDNIWNFSAPGAGMQSTTLYSYGGNLVAPVFYYAVGPSWHMPTPFTIRLFNNASVVNDRPTIYFNYSITAANGSVISGSFDRVEFNSTGGVPPTHPAAMPTFQINGKATNAFGLLNDAEIMLGGPGGGSTTTLLDINASMNLWTLPNGTRTYAQVPAGYSFGTDTGETSEGIAEWATSGSHPMAMLGPGPSLLQPLWGLVGAHPGFVRDAFTFSPTNTFVFANPGATFSTNQASWAPVPPSGHAVYLLTPGVYSYRFLLSDYKPVTFRNFAGGSHAVNLVADRSMGIYTPLWAWNDAQLAAISEPKGTGTVAHPYVIDHNMVGPVDPLFGEFNDYYFPVFPGMIIANTHVYVTVMAPSFPVSYSLPFEGGFSNQFGTPFTNNLQLQFYNATHLSLVNSPLITGWIFAQDPYMASTLFWNSSWCLIGGNTFSVQSNGLILFGGSHNTVWGNTFTSATTTAANPGAVLNSASQNAFQLFESGDLVYNNAFSTPVTASTPGFNFYTGAPATWSDAWNVSKQNASHVRVVNGFPLTGSILGLSYQAGNFWANYGDAANPFGVLPYTDSGAITVGGDLSPIETFQLYHVTFAETGLPSGTKWTVTFGIYAQTTSGSSMTFWDPNGTYAFTVGAISGHTAHPHSGAVTVNGASTFLGIRWS